MKNFEFTRLCVVSFVLLLTLTAPPAQADLLCSGSSRSAPHATDDVVDQWPTGLITIPVLQNDYDPDGLPLTVTSVTSALPAGDTALTADKKAVTFNPKLGHTSATFQYTVSDGTETATATVVVKSAAPTVALTYTCNGDRCSFTLTPSTYKDLVDYTWTFTCPAGASSTQCQSQTWDRWRSRTYYKIFPIGGTWTIKGRANYASGFAPEATISLNVTVPQPFMDFEEYLPPDAADDMCISVNITSCNFVDSFEGEYRIYWDDTTYSVIEANGGTPVGRKASHCYSTPGVKRVRSWVKKLTSGEIGTYDRHFELRNGTPTVSIAAVNDSDDPNIVHITRNDRDDGYIETWEWDMGDGWGVVYEHNELDMAYGYTSPGTYTIRLKVWDNFGLSAVATTEVTIANQPPRARLRTSCQGLTCTFDASGSTDFGAIRDYRWTVNGQTTVTETPVLKHTFATYGVHAMSVVVNDGELTDTARRKFDLRKVEAATPLPLYTVAPCRAYDSGGDPLVAGSTRAISLAPCVPAGAAAVELNATILSATEQGNLRLWKPGSAMPDTSALNFRTDGPRANNAAVAVTGAAVNAQILTPVNGGTARLIIDVLGYYADAASAPLAGGRGPLIYVGAPRRLVDSRDTSLPPLSSATSPITIGQPRFVSAAFLHFAVANPTASGHMKLYDADAAEPPTSVLNFAPNRVTSNGALVATSHERGFKAAFKPATTASAANYFVEQVGYFVPPSASINGPARYVPIAPCRLLDSRDAAYGYGKLVPFAEEASLGGDLPMIEWDGLCGIPAARSVWPSGTMGLRVNVTAVNPPANGWWVDAAPTAEFNANPYAKLNYYANEITSTSTILHSNVMRSLVATDYIIDVVGYYTTDAAVTATDNDGVENQ